MYNLLRTRINLGDFMRISLLILAAVLATSCGNKNVTTKKTIENPFDNSENETRLKNLENKIEALESSISSTISALEESATKQEEQAEEQTNLQESVDLLVTQLAQLQLNQDVIELVDVCPNVQSNGYKETLLRLKNGKLIAYFEQGNQRFLSELKAGSYRTTDSRACYFTVNANNTITN